MDKELYAAVGGIILAGSALFGVTIRWFMHFIERRTSVVDTLVAEAREDMKTLIGNHLRHSTESLNRLSEGQKDLARIISDVAKVIEKCSR